MHLLTTVVRPPLAARQLERAAVAETLEYAKMLGMDEDNDRHLFWIAKAGLKVRRLCATNAIEINSPFDRPHCQRTGSRVRHR